MRLPLWMSVALGLGLAPGCVGTSSSPTQPIDEALPDLPVQEAPWDKNSDLPLLRISEGKLADLEGRITRWPTGPLRLQVVHQIEGARVENHGQDLRERSVSLWLRGWGSTRNLLPQFSMGPMGAGVQDHWDLHLAPGAYVLSVVEGGASEVLVVAVPPEPASR